MSSAIDVVLGAASGTIAGAAIRRAMDAAWRWGWGPQRLGTPGQIIVASAATALVAGALLLGLTLPLQPLVETWRLFATAWIAAFLVAALVVTLWRRSDAA